MTWLLVLWLCFTFETYQIPVPSEVDCEMIASLFTSDQFMLRDIMLNTISECRPSQDVSLAPPECQTMDYGEFTRKSLSRYLVP